MRSTSTRGQFKKRWLLSNVGGASLLGCAIAVLSGAAQADPLPTPTMSASLSANPDPFRVDLDWAGKWSIGGAVSGLVYYYDNPNFGVYSQIDLDNGQAWIEKTDGWWQFYVQASAYSLPSLGTGYIKSSLAPALLFGDVPVAYAKIAPADNFTISAGKLPTLIGDEYTFTFENMNIQRGLLWNQEPAISDGVQANFSNGPFSLALSVNDGYYSQSWNWISGLASYVFNSGADTMAVVAGGNLGNNPNTLPFATPAINNGSIYNLIYTHTSGPWTISPYVQYVSAPSDPLHGVLKGADSVGGALLVNYAVDSHWKLAARAEYVEFDRQCSDRLRQYAHRRPRQQRMVDHADADVPVQGVLRAARRFVRECQRCDPGFRFRPRLRSQHAGKRLLRNRSIALRGYHA